MMRLETSVAVNRPIEEVWAFMLDVFNVPRSAGGSESVRPSPGPIGLGSSYQGRWVIFGLETRVSGAITEWNPLHAATIMVKGAVMRSASLGAILEPITGGTRVVRSAELEPRPALKLLWWIVWPLVRHKSHATDQNFKRLLEAGLPGRSGS